LHGVNDSDVYPFAVVFLPADQRGVRAGTQRACLLLCSSNDWSDENQLQSLCFFDCRLLNLASWGKCYRFLGTVT